jgi:hypothetical protein
MAYDKVKLGFSLRRLGSMLPGSIFPKWLERMALINAVTLSFAGTISGGIIVDWQPYALA